MPIYTDETNADKIIGNIWLGNHLASKDVDFLKHNDIIYVLSVTDDNEPTIDGITHMRIPASSHKMLDRINKDVHDFIDNNNVLVHCKNGHRRSALVMASYLMRKYAMSKQEAIDYIKDKRHRTFPDSTSTRILDLPIKSYVICLESAYEKRGKHAMAMMSEVTDANRFTAVTPKDIDSQSIHPLTKKQLSGIKVQRNQLSHVNQLACALSHISMWKRCVDEPIIVAEDDVSVDRDMIHNNIRLLEDSVPEDADAILLSRVNMNKGISTYE